MPYYDMCFCSYSISIYIYNTFLLFHKAQHNINVLLFLMIRNENRTKIHHFIEWKLFFQHKNIVPNNQTYSHTFFSLFLSLSRLFFPHLCATHHRHIQ